MEKRTMDFKVSVPENVVITPRNGHLLEGIMYQWIEGYSDEAISISFL